MDYEAMETILETIDSVCSYPNNNPYGRGKPVINEQGIKILKAVVKGLYEDED